MSNKHDEITIDFNNVTIDDIEIEDLNKDSNLMNELDIELLKTVILDELKNSNIDNLDIEIDQESIERELSFLELINKTWKIEDDFEIKSHRKIFGKIIILCKKVVKKIIGWYITPLVEKQNVFNSHVTNLLNEMNEKNYDLEKKLYKLEKENQNDLELFKKQSQDEMDFLKKLIKQNKDKLLKTDSKINIDYVLFEDKYRGESSEIKKRLSIYKKYFEGKENILDIGCGRGEFLEILKESGIKARGLEIDEDMFKLCKEKGLEVEKIDGIEYLETIDDESLGGIILTQVIEHLEPNDLIELIKLAHLKLKKDAYIIMETINPQSLIVFTEAYFMDLSHNRMIHPLTIKFLLESEFFNDVDIRYTSKVENSTLIPEVTDFPEEFNRGIRRLNNVVFGYRDYAAIAKK